MREGQGKQIESPTDIQRSSSKENMEAFTAFSMLFSLPPRFATAIMYSVHRLSAARRPEAKAIRCLPSCESQPSLHGTTFTTSSKQIQPDGIEGIHNHPTRNGSTLNTPNPTRGLSRRSDAEMVPVLRGCDTVSSPIPYPITEQSTVSTAQNITTDISSITKQRTCRNSNYWLH